MKKLAALFTVLLLFCSARASEPFTVGAKGAVLIDGASGRVLFAQNADEMLPMASTTKIMTALLALENCELTESVTASKNAHGVPGTSIYLSEGETLTMEQMLYGLMLRSGNGRGSRHCRAHRGKRGGFCRHDEPARRRIGSGCLLSNPHGLDAKTMRLRRWRWRKFSVRPCNWRIFAPSLRPSARSFPGWATHTVAFWKTKTACSRPMKARQAEKPVIPPAPGAAWSSRPSGGNGTDRLCTQLPHLV